MLKLSSGMTVTGLRANMTSPTVTPQTSMPPSTSSPNAVVVSPGSTSAAVTPTSPSALIMAHQQHLRNLQQHHHQHHLHHTQQHPLNKTTSRLSNFSVASLLADTRPRTPPDNGLQLAPTNLSSTPSAATSPVSHESSSSSPASPTHNASHTHPQFHPATMAHHAHLLHAAHAAAAHAQQQHAAAMAAAAAAAAGANPATVHLTHHLPAHLRHPLNTASACTPTGTLVLNTSSPLTDNSANSSNAANNNIVNTSTNTTTTPPASSSNSSINAGEINANNSAINNSTPGPTAKCERHSPIGSSVDSELDYDEDLNDTDIMDHDEEEDSIVDIEDMNNEDSPRSTPDNLDTSKSPAEIPSSLTNSPHLLSPAALAASGHVPIRPTPFSALAAAAVAWGGIGGAGVPWPGPRQIPPFGPPGLFPGQGFGGGVYFANFKGLMFRSIKGKG
ncbi:hypothetical protein GQX74_006587 [Glossina fuscipes]|nr:hypothetical protein GQX74_006587 [Glossina fuscipes]